MNIAFGGRQVMLPGVASIVRALMTSNSRSQVAVTSFETPAPGTLPGIRGQRSLRGAGGLGTLGGARCQPPTCPRHPSSLPTAGGPGRPDAAAATAAAAAGGLQPQLPMVVAADPSQVRVEADARLNAIIVRDAPERLEQYEQLIAALDVEPQSLEIEATIIDLNTERLRELGINWRYNKGRGSLLFGRGDESDLLLKPTTPAPDITPTGRGAFISAVLGGANEFIARINLLQSRVRPRWCPARRC